MNRIPTTSLDIDAVLLPIVRTALATGEAANITDVGDDRFVLLRTDLANDATPITRYCRVGLTARYIDSDGNVRIDLAKGLANRAAAAILASKHQAIVWAEWQSGPVITTDSISKKDVAYVTLLLEVASII